MLSQASTLPSELAAACDALVRAHTVLHEADGAASATPLKSTQREIAESAKAAREDADFRTKVAGEQRDENARAKALAEEQARIAQGTSAKLR